MPKLEAPTCPTCNRRARHSTGEFVEPGRLDLKHVPLYVCDGCGSWVGCHPDGVRPLGVPADPELRYMRRMLHAYILDPLWLNADAGHRYATDTDRDVIRKMARRRVYAFLAMKLGIAVEGCHVGWFDKEMCAEATIALDGVTYADVTAWYNELGKPRTGWRLLAPFRFAQTMVMA